MKVQVLHDSAGNVRGALVSASGQRKGFLVPHGLDRLVTEVDVPELDIDVTTANQDRVAEALERHVTGSKIVSGRLARRDQQY